MGLSITPAPAVSERPLILDVTNNHTSISAKQTVAKNIPVVPEEVRKTIVDPVPWLCFTKQPEIAPAPAQQPHPKSLVTRQTLTSLENQYKNKQTLNTQDFFNYLASYCKTPSSSDLFGSPTQINPDNSETIDQTTQINISQAIQKGVFGDPMTDELAEKIAENLHFFNEPIDKSNIFKAIDKYNTYNSWINASGISEAESKLQTLISAWLEAQKNNNLYNPPTANQFAFAQDDKEYIPTIDQAKNLYPYYPESLINNILAVWTDTGEISIAISETRASDAFDKEFPGIKRPDGSLRMTEIEYLETKDYMQDSLRRYNLNPEVFNEDIVSAIAGDVSAKEFDKRVSLGYEQIINNIPQVKEIYRSEFGMDLTDEAIVAMFISPRVSDDVLENRVLVSSISAEAEVAGVNVGKSVVQQFIRSGMDQQQSRKLFGQVAEVAQGLQFSAAAQGTQISDEQVARGLAGLSPEELQGIRGIASRAESASSVELGSKKAQTGEVTGLIEG